MHSAIRGARFGRARAASRWAGVAASGMLLMIASAVSMMAVAVRPFSSADELYHMDYVVQVWHGRLPVFEDGLFWHPVHNWTNVQFEAQHPPLYYAVLAPIVGPLADGGHPAAATLAGRMVSALLTVGAVACLAWAGSLLSRARRWEYALVTAAVGSSLTVLVHVGGSVYNDSLSTLLTIAGIATAMYAIRTGVTWQVLIGLVLLGAAGGLTRGQFLITALVVGGGAGLGVLLHTAGVRSARLMKAAAVAVLPFVSALLASGWFYWRNVRLTGSWTGGQVAWGVEHMHRVIRPVPDVVTWPAFWGKQWQLLHEPSDTHNIGQYLLTAIAAVAVVRYLVRWVRRRGHIARLDREQAAIVLVLVVQAVVLLVTEIRYVADAGGNNLRYQLPALLPIAAIVAAGFLALPRRVVPVALLGYLAVAWTYFTLWILAQRPAGSALWSGQTPTGGPRTLLLMGIAGLAVGGALQILGLAAYQRVPGARALLAEHDDIMPPVALAHPAEAVSTVD